MESDWVEFLRRPCDGGHAVQAYAHVDELAESVAAYLALGFAAGEPAVVIARPEHRATFARVLAATGWDPDDLTATGLLTVLDADETLALLLLEDGTVSAPAFVEVIGGVIDRVAKGRRVRAFGEMVDVALARGKAAEAAALEDCWNELVKTRRVTLLCGYHLDIFDADAQAAVLPGVCDSHTHVLLAHDAPRLERAVFDAVDEVLGSSSARMLHGIVGENAHERSAPISAQMLMWISERMPRHAERVLCVAREYYERAA